MENLSLSTKAGNAVLGILKGVPEINPLLDSPNGAVRRNAFRGVFESGCGSSIVSRKPAEPMWDPWCGKSALNWKPGTRTGAMWKPGSPPQ